jgi:hypothetical protein
VFFVKVRPSFLILLTLSLLLLFVFSSIPPEKRKMLLTALGIPKLTSGQGQEGPFLPFMQSFSEQNRQKVEEVIESFETHMTACHVPKTRETSEVEAQGKVFKSVDADGKVHFTDKPKGKISEDLTSRYKMEKQYFRMSIAATGGNLPPFLHDRLSADLKQLYFILTRWLPDQYIKQVDLNVKVFNDQTAFDVYREEHVPGLETASGFYKPSMDEAVVMVQRDASMTQSIARHEATHVINAGLYGRTPVWFNEGLAEYFERLNIEGQSKRVNPSPHHLELLQKALAEGELMSVSDYLSIKDRAWRDHEQNMMYAMAWSVVHFMMQDALGRETMKLLMKHMAENFCQPVNAVTFIEQNYVGGMKSFSKRWRTALTSGDFQVHRY